MEFDVEHKPGKDVTAGTRIARKRRSEHLQSCCAPSATTRSTRRASSTASSAHFDFLEGQWEKERHIAPTQDRVARRDLQACPVRVSRRRPSPSRAYFRNAFFENRRYDLSKVGPLQARPQARVRRSPSSTNCSVTGTIDLGTTFRTDNDDPAKMPAHSDEVLRPNEVVADDQLHAPPGEAGAGLQPRRPGPLRQPPHPLASAN